jgi:hypothetical protein
MQAPTSSDHCVGDTVIAEVGQALTQAALPSQRTASSSGSPRAAGATSGGRSG